MKTIKFLMMVLALTVSVSAFAGVEKVTIKTSAQCDKCKAKIEKAVSEIDGVKKYMLNTETKELIVKYDDEVTSLEAIEKVISNTGYWANEKAPNREAYAALDACCKPKKACCASKKSCSKDAASKSSCSKDAAAKASCSKDGEAKKACCSKDGEKKECSHAKEGDAAKKSCSGHGHK